MYRWTLVSRQCKIRLLWSLPDGLFLNTICLISRCLSLNFKNPANDMGLNLIHQSATDERNIVINTDWLMFVSVWVLENEKKHIQRKQISLCERGPLEMIKTQNVRYVLNKIVVLMMSYTWFKVASTSQEQVENKHRGTNSLSSFSTQNKCTRYCLCCNSEVRKHIQKAHVSSIKLVA